MLSCIQSKVSDQAERAILTTRHEANFHATSTVSKHSEWTLTRVPLENLPCWLPLVGRNDIHRGVAQQLSSSSLAVSKDGQQTSPASIRPFL